MQRHVAGTGLQRVPVLGTGDGAPGTPRKDRELGMRQWDLTATQRAENPLSLVGLSVEPVAGPALSWPSRAMLEGHAEVWVPQALGTGPKRRSQLLLLSRWDLFGRTCQSLAGFPSLMKGVRVSESFTR